jgi:hypothetical protein
MSSLEDMTNNNKNCNTRVYELPSSVCVPIDYYGPEIIYAHGNEQIIAIDSDGQYLARNNASDGSCEYQIIAYRVKPLE